jgi:surface antigen
MPQELGQVFHKFRFLLAGLLTVGFLVLISALVTAVGSSTVLAAKPNTSVNPPDVSMYDSPNVVTATAYKLGDGTKHALLSTGTGLYSVCRSITTATTHSGSFVAHSSAPAARGISSGAMFVGRGMATISLLPLRMVSGGVMFALRGPSHLFGSMTQTRTVGSIIRPADDRPVPVINTKLSPEMVARITAQAQQDARDQHKISEQIAANRGLDGVLVAGDPQHGGYPTKWDNSRQDSMLDSWGMFNRECVSYAAWKVYQTYGNMPFWGGVGNANQWPADARAAGISTGSTPQVHSVAISRAGYYGHAMWVEKVSGDMAYVSQYNYDYRGHYSEMWVNGSYFTYIYFR